MVDHERRAALRAFAGIGISAASVAASVTLGSRTARAQDQKLGKEVVQYQDQPKDGAECDKCVNWVAPNGCTIVAGEIHPKGWCVAYAPKEG